MDIDPIEIAIGKAREHDLGDTPMHAHAIIAGNIGRKFREIEIDDVKLRRRACGQDVAGALAVKVPTSATRAPRGNFVTSSRREAQTRQSANSSGGISAAGLPCATTWRASRSRCWIERGRRLRR